MSSVAAKPLSMTQVLLCGDPIAAYQCSDLAIDLANRVWKCF